MYCWCAEGIERLKKEHPDVDLYIAAIDSHLDKNKFIVPGLGDFGDQVFWEYLIINRNISASKRSRSI